MKAWIAFSLLAWAALWPLGHRALVAVYDVNPWKLGAFAMYTSATPPVLVVAFAPQGSQLVPIDDRELSAEAQTALRGFRIQRHAIGRLHVPDEFADAILRDRPDLAGVVVMVQRMKLDPKTARMTSTRDRYVYERGERAGAPREEKLRR